MESDVAQLSVLDQFWAWFELHRKQTLWGVLVVLVIGMGVGFYYWHMEQRQANANSALAEVASTGFGPAAQTTSPRALLKVAANYPNTAAAQRALLLAGAGLFDQGRYAEARGQFEKFLRDYPDSPFTAQALLGVASSYDAQGQDAQAITAYTDLVQHYATQNVAPQAKLALGRIYERTGKIAQARDLFQDLTHADFGSISSEAMVHLQAMRAANPEPAAGRPAARTPALPKSGH